MKIQSVAIILLGVGRGLHSTDDFQNLINYSLYHPDPSRKFHQNPFVIFWERQLVRWSIVGLWQRSALPRWLLKFNGTSLSQGSISDKTFMKIWSGVIILLGLGGSLSSKRMITKIYWTVPYTTPNPSRKFHWNPFITSYVILLTDTHTNQRRQKYGILCSKLTHHFPLVTDLFSLELK